MLITEMNINNQKREKRTQPKSILNKKKILKQRKQTKALSINKNKYKRNLEKTKIK